MSVILPNNITYNDLKYRLQNIQCCLPNKAVELYNRINLGINCCNEERELNVAMAYLDMLKCYITNWETPYTYQESIELGSSSLFTIGFEIAELDANSEIITSFSINFIGYYSVTYPTPVSMNTVINDYIAATGYNMSIVSIQLNPKSTQFNLSLYVNCKFSEFSALVNFDYFLFPEIEHSEVEATFGPCEYENINIIGPTYTSQDQANCLSIEEVVNMFEWLQKYCCMCFPNYGNYDNIVELSNNQPMPQ